MAISIGLASELRDKLYNLNLNYLKDIEIYEALLFSFIKENEGESLRVYSDSKNIKTIGIGFNMNDSGARNIWQKIFGNSISFAETFNGKKSINVKQSRMIYNYKKDSNRQELINIYGSAWHKLKANERVMIEDLYWNGSSKLVGKRTNFYKNIILYTESSECKYLINALYEVRERSNLERSFGIQNRRNAEAAIGDSSYIFNKASRYCSYR